MLKKEISYYSIMNTDATYTEPRFIKEKNEPLRLVINTPLKPEGRRFNVIHSGKFSKKFRREIRRMYKIKPFQLPKIKTFERVGINVAGNIVEKSKEAKRYSYQFQYRFSYWQYPDLQNKEIDLHIPTKLPIPDKLVQFNFTMSNPTKNKVQKKINFLVDYYVDGYNNEDDGQSTNPTNFIKKENLTKMKKNIVNEPHLPIVVKSNFAIIPDSKHIDTKQKWNTGNNMCFYDYIKHLYGTKMENGKWNNKIPMELRLLANNKERLWEIMTGINDFDAEHIDGDWGVSKTMIERLCKRFEISCYLVNEADEFICYYQNNHPKKKKIPPIYALLTNGHFNPIITDHKKKSLQHRAMGSKKKKDKKRKEENKEVSENIEIVKIPIEGDMFEVLAQKIIETGKTPLPLGLRCDTNNFDGFMLEDEKYIYDTEDNQMGELFSKMRNEKWRGTGMKGYAMRMFEEKKYLKSNLTPELYELFTDRQVKDRSHRGFINGNFTLEDDLLAIDVNKAYTDCVLNPLDQWYIMGFDSVWLPFEKAIKGGHSPLLQDGFYYVETEDTLLFHRSNIYSKCIVELGLKEKIITRENIKKFLPTIKVVKKNRFKKLFDEYMNICPENKKVGKYCCNLMTGLLGIKSKKKIKTRLSTNFQDVAKYYNDYDKKQIFLQSTPLTNNKELYVFGVKNEIPKINNHLPNYIQILDNMNVRQYNMMKTFMKPEAFVSLRSGEVAIYRKVDMFCCKSEHFKRNWKSKLSKKIGGYKQEIPKKLFMSSYEFRSYILPEMDFERGNPEKFFSEKINDSNQFDLIEKWVMGHYEEKGNSKIHNNLKLKWNFTTTIKFEPKDRVLMIEGDGGTGKTHIIKKFDEKYRCLKMAFTNKACININGTTYHRGLGLNKRLEISPSKFNTIERDYDLIVCEEFSMNTAWIWNYILWLRKMTTLPIVLCGDWGQCRPVEKHTPRYNKYKFHPSVIKLVGKSKITLTKNHRCSDDKPFAEFLSKNKNNMNELDVSEFIYIKNLRQQKLPFITKHLCYYNSTRKKINREVSEKVLKRQGGIFYELKSGNKKDKNDKVEFAEQWADGVEYDDVPPKGKDKNPQQNIKIFTGTPMIARMTEEKGEKLFNNEDFVITEITEEKVKLQSQNRDLEYEISLAELQSKFLVAWCITTHKAQGQTIKENILIHDWGYMNNEIKYTAMSRATNSKRVFIENFTKANDFGGDNWIDCIKDGW